jgi:GT2 family glycosyltransferase
MDQTERESIRLSVFLVDDGSSDGTTDAVRTLAPTVQIIQGNGQLFWAGGMRLGIAAAMAADVDLILWLNDDTILFPGALAALLATWAGMSAEGTHDVIVVGSTQALETGAPSYGGVRRIGRFNRARTELIAPSATDALACDSMNGNCVLVPRSAALRLGNIDSAYVHGLGDFDYGFRAMRLGIALVIAPGFLGQCNRNPPLSAAPLRILSLRKRWQVLSGPKVLPVRAWATFCRRHAGPLWMLVFVSPYLKLLLSASWARVSQILTSHPSSEPAS